MNNSKFEQLSEHAFVKIVLKDNAPLIKAESKAELNKTLPPKFSTLQLYKRAVGHRTGELLTQIDRIEQATILTGSYPYIKQWRTNYGQFEYFQYHIEAYYLGIIGFFDRLLHLINQLYLLGLEDREVDMKQVIKKLKRHPETQTLTALLKRLGKGLAGARKIRNSVTHAERFYEKDLFHIGLLEHSLNDQMIDDENGFLMADLSWNVKTYREKKKKLLETNNDMLTPILGKFLNELEIIYRKQRLSPKGVRSKITEVVD